MIRTLRESKAKLSELVERAAGGEDVLITVRGKAKARLTRASVPAESARRPAWVRELRALQKAYSKAKSGLRVDEILASGNLHCWPA
jgi:prevent-host-death family protein